MTLFKLKSAPFILLEDDSDKNILPLLLELVKNESCPVNMICYEQPFVLWKKVFKSIPNAVFHEEFTSEIVNKCTNTKCSVVIDSINQMALCLGWSECLQILKSLQTASNAKLIVVLHKDCLSNLSRLRVYLNHLASAIVSYDTECGTKIRLQLKKSGKVVKTEEYLYIDNQTNTLKTKIEERENKMVIEPEKLSPATLTTFKIEVNQKDQMEKSKLKLPYMSKQEGESKVYYEPDAVDDWDEEDPDDDLDL